MKAVYEIKKITTCEEKFWEQDIIKDDCVYTYFFGWSETFSFSIKYECKVKKFNIDYYIFGVDWNLLWFQSP